MCLRAVHIDAQGGVLLTKNTQRKGGWKRWKGEKEGEEEGKGRGGEKA